MQLDVNLAEHVAQRPQWWRVAAWVAGTLLVAGGTAAHGLYYRSLATSVAVAEDRLQKLEKDMKEEETKQRENLQVGGSQGALAALPKRVEAYNRIITAAAFSWTELLMELEASLPPNVGLTSIQPDPTSGTVMLQGRARSFADITRFVNLLEQRTTFREVFLLRHGEQGGGAAREAILDFGIRLVYGAPV